MERGGPHRPPPRAPAKRYGLAVGKLRGGGAVGTPKFALPFAHTSPKPHLPIAQPKYAARFENFFANLRLNRDQFADMAAFTLQALQGGKAKYKAVADPLDVALTDYRTTHAGQLSGEGQASTITLAQALVDFKGYVKKTERKVIDTAYEAGTPDLLAIFPKGRSRASPKATKMRWKMLSPPSSMPSMPAPPSSPRQCAPKAARPPA